MAGSIRSLRRHQRRARFLAAVESLWICVEAASLQRPHDFIHVLGVLALQLRPLRGASGPQNFVAARKCVVASRLQSPNPRPSSFRAAALGGLGHTRQEAVRRRGNGCVATEASAISRVLRNSPDGPVFSTVRDLTTFIYRRPAGARRRA